MLQVRFTTAFRSFRMRDVLNDPPNGSLEDDTVEDNDDVEVNYMTQPLDHFASATKQSTATFQQRYFSSTRFVVANDDSRAAYAFLCVGGEGPGLTKSVLVDSVHCTGDMIELARRLSSEQNANVYLFALEHRYYGHSYPFLSTQNHSSALELHNLLYLSSKQAVEDIASFVRRVQIIPASLKWVTFGGSYPGFLSAMARQLHPELIHASVSSSAPVDFVIDFKRYHEHTAFDLQYSRIGGSDQCLQIVQQGHADIAENIASGEIELVGKLFGLCNASQQLLESQYNLDMFLGDGVVNIPAQGNDPSCNDTDVCNIQHICDFLTSSKQLEMSNMERLGALARKQQYSDDTCIMIDWNQTILELSNTTVDPDGENWRSWLWQTCTEFGYYQTCEKDSTCPYGRGYHNIDIDYEICRRIFHLSPSSVKKNIAATTTYYRVNNGSEKSRILSINGDVDPWSELAVINSTTTLLPAYMVPGASHHYWTHPIKATDDIEIQKARNLIYNTVTTWLEEDVDLVAIQ